MGLKKIIKQIIVQFRPQYITKANVSILAPNELLKGRTALITGGTSGIGYAIAKEFIRAGAYVVITGRNHTRVDEACGKLKKETCVTEGVYGIEFNNKDVKGFEERFDEVLNIIKNRHIDILVNNAGVNGPTIECVTEEEYDNIMDTNMKATFFLSRLIGRYMIANRIKGNILNIASASSLRPANGPYGLTKWGIRGFTLGLAKTLVKDGITVNAIAPGATATPMMHKDANDNISNASLPLGRYILPQEIANMAVFLVSDMGHSIVGDTIYMTGGAGNVSLDGVNYNI